MIILETASKWQGFDVYDAQTGPYGKCLVRTNPEAHFTLGQNIRVAELGNVPGSSDGFTPWQSGTVTRLEPGKVYITVPALPDYLIDERGNTIVDEHGHNLVFTGP